MVGNIRRAALTDEPRADMYFPMEQGTPPAATFFVRTGRRSRRAVAPDVEPALQRIEPRIILTNARPLDAVAAESVGDGAAGAVAARALRLDCVALAAVGIYAVMSSGVRQRIREIGTRMAIGATRGQITWLVLPARGRADRDRPGYRRVGLAALAGHTLTPLLYQTSASDPVTLTASLAVLAAVALAACLIPARRARPAHPARLLEQQG